VVGAVVNMVWSVCVCARPLQVCWWRLPHLWLAGLGGVACVLFQERRGEGAVCVCVCVWLCMRTFRRGQYVKRTGVSIHPTTHEARVVDVCCRVVC